MQAADTDNFDNTGLSLQMRTRTCGSRPGDLVSQDMYSNINLIFAYFSPETPLPVGSIVATVLGVAMMLRGEVRCILIRCISASFDVPPVLRS